MRDDDIPTSERHWIVYHDPIDESGLKMLGDPGRRGKCFFDLERAKEVARGYIENDLIESALYLLSTYPDGSIELSAP